MRMPEEKEDLTGKICVAPNGKIGIITASDVVLAQFPYDERFHMGIDIHSQTRWAARNPCVLAESAIEYYERIERIQQKSVSNPEDVSTY